MADELLILYNAAGSLMGHFAYGYHHIVKTKGRDCSACRLTHGPTLSVSESQGWCDLKHKLEIESDLAIRQLHTDETSESEKSFLLEHRLSLPCVLRRRQGKLAVVFTKEEMDDFNGDPARFEQALEKRIRDAD